MCVDYGPDGSGCRTAADCGPGFLCRNFDASACTCDPRPGAWEDCAPRCESNDDCNQTTASDLADGRGFMCDLSRGGICRTPPSCLSDDECLPGQQCVDNGLFIHWYVTGDGGLAQLNAPRRCSSPGSLSDGAECIWGAECSSGSCADDQCRPACTNNADCAPDQRCQQGSHGAPYCTTQAECDGQGEDDQLCRRRRWVVSCSPTQPCTRGDCQYPDADPGNYGGYGGLGFGVGQCTEDQRCEPDHFRSEWVDTWIAPMCFDYTPCWDDDDCESPYTCMALDAVESTRRCGKDAGQ